MVPGCPGETPAMVRPGGQSGQAASPADVASATMASLGSSAPASPGGVARRGGEAHDATRNANPSSLGEQVSALLVVA